MIYILICDGSSIGNPGPGGFAYALWNKDKDEIMITAKAFVHTTNNIMELSSIIEGLKKYNNLPVKSLYTDSMYAVNGITKWIHIWKKNRWLTTKKSPVKNLELWLALEEVISQKAVDLIWIKGHNRPQDSDSIFNRKLITIQNIIDEYARNAARKQCDYENSIQINIM